MRPGKHNFSFLLFVIVASLATMAHGYHKHPEQRAGYDIAALSRHHQVLSPEIGGASFQEPARGLPRRVEKRHGKSLLSQAIAADYAPVIEPGFTYCHRNYTLFLPGGCARQMIGNFSLRGPPSLA